MLPNGSRLAPRVCLRCELQQLVLCCQQESVHPKSNNVASPRAQSHGRGSRRAFSSAHNEKQQERVIKQKDFVIKHLHPATGLVVGKPGKRQRQTSAQLAATSLGKPVDVVLLKDFVEKRRAPSTAYTNEQLEEAEDVVDEIRTESPKLDLSIPDVQEPDRQEVESSIEGMRPKDLYIGQKAFTQLLNAVVAAHNVEQLKRYLRVWGKDASSKVLKSSTVLVTRRSKGKQYQERVNAISKSTWRLGRTALTLRHLPSVRNRYTGPGKHAKKTFAERILREVWELVIEQEQRQVGELEMHLEPWQVSILFDLKRNGKHMYQTLLDSQLLLKAARVEPYRPDNVVRITARKQIAEEVARQLERKLLSHARLNVPIATVKSILGEEASNLKGDQLFNHDILKQVSNLTQAVFSFEDDNTIVIRALRPSNAHSARRSLLGLLGLPGPINTVVVADLMENKGGTSISSTQNDPKYLFPFNAGPELHKMYLGRQWRRQGSSTPSRIDTSPGPESLLVPNAIETSSVPNPKAVADLDKLDSVSPPNSFDRRLSIRERSDNPDSYWLAADVDRHSQQYVRVGRHLESVPDETIPFGPQPVEADGPRGETIFLPHCAAQTVVLSRMRSLQVEDGKGAEVNVTDTPLLELQYMPDVFSPGGTTALQKLPRIRLLYERPSSANPTFKLRHVVAVWRQTNTSIVLPDYSFDLQLAEESHLLPDMAKFHKDAQIEDLTRTLNDSLMQDKDAFLNPRSSITFPLPMWLAGDSHQDTNKPALFDGDDWKPVDVAYMLERFELRTRHTFVPLPESDRSGLEDLSAALGSQGQKLCVTEVNGGVLAGRRLELSVNSIGSGEEETPSPIQKKSLVKTGLMLVDGVTQAEKGTLRLHMATPSGNGVGTTKLEEVKAEQQQTSHD